MNTAQRLVLFSLNGAGAFFTIEPLFFNARWLEREVAEMCGSFFLAKRDRRALFLTPLLYWAPLRKAFPVGGFFEVRLSFEDGKLVYLPVAWAE